MMHKLPINELSFKPNMDEKEQRLKPPVQEDKRLNKEEANSGH